MTNIVRIALPLRAAEDVIPHLGKPTHWQQGRSAKSVADSWFRANDIPHSQTGLLALLGVGEELAVDGLGRRHPTHGIGISH